VLPRHWSTVYLAIAARARKAHPTAPMISDREFSRSFGFQLEIEPVKPDFLIEEAPNRNFLGADLQIVEIPGHCPGSLCSNPFLS